MLTITSEETEHKRAIKKAEKLYGGSDPSVSVALIDLANFYKERHRDNEAADCFFRAEQILENWLLVETKARL